MDMDTALIIHLMALIISDQLIMGIMIIMASKVYIIPTPVTLMVIIILDTIALTVLDIIILTAFILHHIMDIIIIRLEEKLSIPTGA